MPTSFRPAPFGIARPVSEAGRLRAMAGGGRGSHRDRAEREPVERTGLIRPPAVARGVHDDTGRLFAPLAGAQRQFLHDFGEMGAAGIASGLRPGGRLQPDVETRQATTVRHRAGLFAMEGIGVHQEALSMSRVRVGKRAAPSIMDQRPAGFNANGIVHCGIWLATNYAKYAFP
ncbi:hypothetical protein HUT06_42350 [Actinomadura sp. NAK00032]|uniref:hypothetical protein n=1 Tax=Actinomadura sp. NAK00032 TaxID=2742128 RepID=UPI001590AF85|nr:hypothetical protein [Actinomadura sp. NAK00032]QKW39856.1 hypothetical protein HUT06_42350 [Actinomadura sp. NAK00032]